MLKEFVITMEAIFLTILLGTNIFAITFISNTEEQWRRFLLYCWYLNNNPSYVPYEVNWPSTNSDYEQRIQTMKSITAKHCLIWPLISDAEDHLTGAGALPSDTKTQQTDPAFPKEHFATRLFHAFAPYKIARRTNLEQPNLCPSSSWYF